MQSFLTHVIKLHEVINYQERKDENNDLTELMYSQQRFLKLTH